MGPRVVAAGLLFLAASSAADTYYLADGDRITGKPLASAAGQYRVQTAYGRLAIPKAKVQKIVHDDGREEVLIAPAPAAEPTPAPEPPVALALVVTGASFWQAWSPAQDPAPDPTLRLVVSLDEEVAVTYVDAEPDPDIPGALVNTFSFQTEHLGVTVAPGFTARLPPEAQPGRVALRIEAPARLLGERRLRVAYQTNAGSPAEPSWRDLAEGAIHAELKAGSINVIRLHQDRGTMEFSRKKMKNVETFRIEMGLE